MSEEAALKTSDGVSLAGDYYPSGSGRGVILLHMMPSDRKSWVTLAGKLQEAAFQSIAIDLRGHGESQGGPDGYRRFSDADHQASSRDVAAAAEFLKSKGAKDLFLAGASIGANLALQYLAENPQTKAAILLSPGLNYHGVETLPLTARINESQGVYLAASEEDTESLEAVKALSDKMGLGDERVLKIFRNVGHGTTLLERIPRFGDELVKWFKKF